jgi:hypothetical protein
MSGAGDKDLVQRARHFATQAHGRIDQRRKYSNQPYEVHLKSVAALVAEICDDEEMIAAAWLHDTVEDTPATLEDIEREFGAEVAALVDQLTDVSRAHDGNRAARKAIDRAHLAQASPRAKTVKLADLIDNARDICKHDSRFARVYLQEMAALLEVLQEGDARMLARARKTLEKQSAKLGLAVGAMSAEPERVDASVKLPLPNPRQQRFFEIFTQALVAEDIAEPLPSFDGIQPADLVASVARQCDYGVIGLRASGHVEGYALQEDLSGGLCLDHLRRFSHSQLLDRRASLTEVVQALTRHDYCFVRLLDQVVGVIGRAQMQLPPVRMWLFGIITSYEMGLTEMIRRLPLEIWRARLSSARQEKAEQLRQARQAMGQHVPLLDCLQLSDKLHIMAADAQLLQQFGFDSKGKAQRVAQDIESLRNNLAHAQDIVTHDWVQIARLARRIDMLANGMSMQD